ncbi:hypothetical protein PFLL34_02037 [Pseudomonas fluorescens]|nr:hypothetical protein PFLL34_02037 [Pseudomonas fluorescens]
MQAVAFEVADDAPVEVDLVQVAAAVVQAVEPTAVGQLRLDQVAELIVVVVQAAGGALFDKQLAARVVGEGQCLGGFVIADEGDSGKLVQRVVGVFGATIIGLFQQQAAHCIAFKSMHN